MSFVVAVDEAVVAEESSVDLHAIKTSKRLLVVAICDAFRTEGTVGGVSYGIFPFGEEKR